MYLAKIYGNGKEIMSTDSYIVLTDSKAIDKIIISEHIVVSLQTLVWELHSESVGGNAMVGRASGRVGSGDLSAQINL